MAIMTNYFHHVFHANHARMYNRAHHIESCSCMTGVAIGRVCLFERPVDGRNVGCRGQLGGALGHPGEVRCCSREKVSRSAVCTERVDRVTLTFVFAGPRC